MLAEVAPFLIPQFDGLLVDLLPIAGCLVALGIVVVLHGFVRATVGGLGALLGKLPGIGGILSSPVNHVYHWMNHQFAAAELTLDHVLAYFLHDAARCIAWIGREIRDNANLLRLVAGIALGTAAIDALNRLTEALSHRLAGVEHAADLALQRIHGLERSTVARVENWIDPRVHALEHAIDGVIYPDIAGLRARTRELLDRLDNTWKQVRKLDALLGTAAITAAVAVALARLDLSWIRCRNWKNIGKGICGVPSWLIEALLAGAIDAMVVTDLCDLSYLMIAAAEEIRPVLLDFVDVEEALIGCHGNTAPPALRLAPTDLPVVQAPLAIAS